jgi:GNAT superfamily N-acetyltransferase
MKIEIEQATPADAPEVSLLVKALLEEIMAKTGAPHFKIDLEQMVERCRGFLAGEAYTIFKAISAGQIAGVITLSECRALYTEGVFGIIPELYVAPAFRSEGVGERLLQAAQGYGRERGWKRLEVTTPPLPEFDRTLRFYEKHGFSITGGRKLKLTL